MRTATEFAAGLVFGLGRLLSGLEDPATVLDVAGAGGARDTSLAFVMGGATTLAFARYRLAWARESPLLAARFGLPQNAGIVRPRMIAAPFGVGWGIGSFCPGPARTATPMVTRGALAFLPTVLAGFGLDRRARAAPVMQGA